MGLSREHSVTQRQISSNDQTGSGPKDFVSRESGKWRMGLQGNRDKTVNL